MDVSLSGSRGCSLEGGRQGSDGWTDFKLFIRHDNLRNRSGATISWRYEADDRTTETLAEARVIQGDSVPVLDPVGTYIPDRFPALASQPSPRPSSPS